MCDNNQKLEKLTVDTSPVRNNQWTHLSLLASQSQGSYLILQQNKNELARSYRQTYINLQQRTATWRVCLGGCDSQHGFKGSFRELKVLSQFVTPDMSSKLKNNYLIYDQKILAYFRFSESDFSNEQFRNVQAQIWRRENINSKNQFQLFNAEEVEGKDLIPNDICYPINEVKSFLNLSSINIEGSELETIKFDNRWKPLSKGWAYSVNLWVKIGLDTCTASSPAEALKNCHLVLLKDAFMLYLLPDKNSIILYFFNPKLILESVSKTLFVPQDQWVNIQIAMNHYNGYDMRTYDILGRQIGIVTESRDLQEQRSTKKELSLFKGFRGVVKSVFVTTQREKIPMTLQKVNHAAGEYFYDDKCLTYLIFEKEHLIYNEKGDQQVVNYCIQQNFNASNVAVLSPAISASPRPFQLQQTYHRDFALLQTDFTQGLISDASTPFDGISCQDDSFFPLWNKETSYISSEFKTDNNLTEVTIEFWYRGDDKFNGEIAYMMSLWSNDTEILSIQRGANGTLDCGYFYNESTRVSAKYPKNDVSKAWTHVMCTINGQGIVSGMMIPDKGTQNDTLNANSDKNKTGTFMVSNGTYELVIGNNKDKMKGFRGMQVREFRIWGRSTNIYEVSLNKYRQIDPSSPLGYSLLAYMRLSEGDYTFYDLISNSLASSSGDISLVQDQDLLICPLGTYPSTDKTKCFRDLVSNAVISIYPVQLATNQTGWRFSIEDSELVNQAYSQEVRAKWEFQDKMLRNIAEPFSSMKTFVISANAFRESVKYDVRVTISSDASNQTYSRELQSTFVPVSCQYFLVNNKSANSVFTNYTTEKSFENITFTLNLISAKPYCNEIAFYKDLRPSNLSYKIVYDEDYVSNFSQAQLVSVWDEASKKFTITIPKKEQYKFPILKNIKFLFDFVWENKEHSDLFPSTGLTFQNAMFTINFLKEGSFLVPFIKTLSPVTLVDETAVFYANDTYITNRAKGQEKLGLKFNWTCPQGLQAFCSNQTNSTLTVEYKDFLSAKLLFNTSYTFKVRIDWNNKVNNSDVSEFSEVETKAIWFNYSVPFFELQRPSQILLTSDSIVFSANPLNNQIPDLSILSVEWSIVPNISLQTLPLSSNNTMLTLPKEALLPRKSYTITVTISNKLYTAVQRVQSLTFVTKMPPYGGSVKVDPYVGYLGETEFTVQLFNWESDNKPLKYQVWTAQDSGGEVQSQHLTGIWFDIDQEFKFRAINTNPLIVLIKDQVGEVIKQKIVIMVRPPEIKTDQQDNGMFQLRRYGSSQLRKTLAESLNNQNSYSKLNIMSGFIDSLPVKNIFEDALNNSLGSNFTSQTQENLTISQQAGIALDLLENYLTSNRTSTIDPVVASIEIKTLTKSFSTLVNQSSDLFSASVAKKTFQVLDVLIDDMMNKEVRAQLFDSQNLNNTEVVHQVYSVMAGLIKNSFNQNETAETSANDQNNTLKVNDVLKSLGKFNSIMCSTMDKSQHIISQNVETMLKNTTFDGEDFSSFKSLDDSTLSLNVSLLQEALRVSSGCLQATYFSFDIFETRKDVLQNLTQISSTISSVKFDLGSDIDPLELKNIATYTYSMRPSVNLTVLERQLAPKTPTISINETESSANSTSSSQDVKGLSPANFSQNTTTDNKEAGQGRRLQESIFETTIVGGVEATPTENASQLNKTQDSQNQTAEQAVISSQLEISKRVVCMAYSGSRGVWDHQMCSTKINYQENQVECQCTSVDSLLQGVFVLNMNFPEVVDLTSYSKKKPYVTIAVIFSIITVFVPLIASVMDWFDLDKANDMERKLSIYQRKIHSKVLDIQPSLWYWFLNHDQDPSKESLLGQSAQKLSFLGVVKLTHPFLNMITRYDGQRKSRFFRIMPWLAQCAAYTIVIIFLSDIFYGADSQEESSIGSISETQAIRIIEVGFAGMCALLPWPFVQLFIKRSSIDPIRVQHCDTVGDVTPRKSQDRQENKITPTKDANNRPNRQDYLGTEEAMQGDELTIHQKVNINKRQLLSRPSILNRILAFLTIGACIAAVAISAIFLEQKSLSIQYCVISSFFMGIFGSLFLPHFVYAFWQYLLYVFFYEEQVVLPSADILSMLTSHPDQHCCQSFLMDSALLSHQFEQLIIRRANLDGNLRSSSSTYKNEKLMLQSKKSRSDLSVNNQQPSVMQTQIQNPNSGNALESVRSHPGSDMEAPPMGTIEKQQKGSPFAQSAKDAYTATPNVKGSIIERTTTDKGMVMYRNTSQIGDFQSYQEKVTNERADQEIAQIEVDDDPNESNSSNRFKIPPREILEISQDNYEGQQQLIEIGSSRDVKSNRNITPESTQMQIVPSSLTEINEEKGDARINSQSRLIISSDEMRGSALNSSRPEQNEIKNRFYGEDQPEDQPEYDEMEDDEPYKNSGEKRKKSNIIDSISDALNTSQSKIQRMSTQVNKRQSDYGGAYHSKDPHSAVHYSPIKQNKADRPKTSVNPVTSYQDNGLAATTLQPGWMEEADESGKHSEFQIPEDRDDLEDNEGHILE